MGKIVSLCRNSEFQRLYRRGKIGKAVYRNRAKRRIRELFRRHQNELMTGLDICIVARPRILTASAEKVESDFISAAAELGILNSNCRMAKNQDEKLR